MVEGALDPRRVGRPKTSRARAGLAAFSCSLSLLGCAQFEWSAAPTSTRRVAVVYEGKPDVDLHAQGRLESAARTAGGATLDFFMQCGAGVGHGGGAGLLTALALAGCAAISVALVAPGGAAYGAYVGLPSDAAEALDRTVPLLVDEQGVQQQLAADVSSRLAARHKIVSTPAEADAVLTLTLTEIRIEQYSGSRVALVVAASGRFERSGASAWAVVRPVQSARYEGAPVTYRAWLENEGTGFVAELARALRKVSTGIAAEVDR